MTQSTIEEIAELLEVTASNIRSLGPAGFIPFPYRDWLTSVEAAASDLRSEYICPKCGRRRDPIQEAASF